MPDVAQMAIGRYRWMSESWSLGSAAELDGLLANLAPGIERQHLVLRLRLSGLLTLAERVALRDRLESELAHEVRWLDLNLDDLYARPTDADLADIDANGVLRVAAERLHALSATDAAAGRRAAAALDPLYFRQRHNRKRGGW